ncbi:MAG: hypothetical protein C7B46_12435 [Sulfobacillus benefaciens]|uniref:Uncharacterized protein n=1 Tax=Sulfobacillus benefaciens TaxID=453960 RepID=A0A2T2XEK0_9FIRM|nr:MAG: hypothetical protein C7B46_12435 [Sulfobacillus benefaciens]
MEPSALVDFRTQKLSSTVISEKMSLSLLVVLDCKAMVQIFRSSIKDNGLEDFSPAFARDRKNSSGVLPTKEYTASSLLKDVALWIFL